MSKREKNERTFTRNGKKLYKYYANSPYWDWLFHKTKGGNDGGGVNELKEPLSANPDICEENSFAFMYKEDKINRERKEVLKHILRAAIQKAGLSKQEKIVIQKVIYDGVRVGELAKELGLAHNTISTVLKRATIKIAEKVKTLVDKYEI